MASEDVFGTVASGLGDKIFSSILYFGIAIIIIFVLGGTMWYFLLYKKKFDIKIKVMSERSSGNNVEMFDKGGILTDRSNGSTYLRVWGLKRDFIVPQYDIMRKVYSDGKELDYIEIYRRGENEFYFLMKPKIDKTRIVRASGNTYTLAEQSQTMVDPEMAFWAVKRKTQNKKMIDTDSLVLKLLPHLPAIFGGVLMIFLSYVVMDNFPAILSELRSLVSEMRSLNRADIVTGSFLGLLKWKM